MITEPDAKTQGDKGINTISFYPLSALLETMHVFLCNRRCFYQVNAEVKKIHQRKHQMQGAKNLYAEGVAYFIFQYWWHRAWVNFNQCSHLLVHS